MSRVLRLVLPGLVSGLLMVVSLPSPDQHIFIWICLVPLLFATATAPTWREAALAGYAAGIAYFAGTCYWISDTMILYGGLSSFAATAVTVLFVVVFALHIAVFAAALKLLSRFSLTYFAAVAWMAMELFRTYAPFGGFPWMLLGYAVVPYPAALQTAAWFGVYGLSFLVVLINGLFAEALFRRSARLAVAGIFLVAAFRFLPAPADPPSQKLVQVRLVQPNLAFEQSWDAANYDLVLEQLAKLSEIPEAQPGASRLIVWPETSAPFYFDEDPGFSDHVKGIARAEKAHFVFGYIGSSGDSPTNSAAQLDPEGSVLSRYDKIHLVPFGEYVPARRALFFAASLLEAVGGFVPGTEYSVATIDREKAATIICYESIFPPLVREFVVRGAGLIVLITNDGWFGESAAPYQHLRMGVVRAVETGRWIVRAANTGITAIIDPRGRIRAATRLNERTAISGVAEFRSDQTFYTRYGDVFAFANIAAAAAAAIWRIRRNKNVRRVE